MVRIILLFCMIPFLLGFGVFCLQDQGSGSGGGGTPCEDKAAYVSTLDGVAAGCETWSLSGTIDCGYTTTVAYGTYSVLIDADGGTETMDKDFTAWSDGGIFFLYYATDATPSAQIIGFLKLRDSVDGIGTYLDIKTDGNFRLVATGGTSNSSTYGALSNATWYAVWINTATDGTAELYTDTKANACTGGTCTRPASTVATVSGGTNSNNMSNSLFYLANSHDVVIDKLRVDNAEITNVTYCDAD